MIDAHIHVVPPQLPGAGSLAPILRSPPERVAAIIREEMRTAGMTTAFAMGEYRCTPDDPLGVNRTLRLAELVPGLSAIGIMDPVKDAQDSEHFVRVEQQLANPKIVALKGYLGYLHYEPAHPTYRRYYELAEQYKKPVYFHTGDTYSPYGKLKYAHPLGVDEVAVDHPEVRFIIAHVGNPWTIDAAAVVYKNMNVWTDLSGLVVGETEDLTAEEAQDGLADVADRVRKAFRYAGRPNRFLFGTDWPLVPIAAYANFIRSMIPSEFHEQVFVENAVKLFRLG